MIPYVAQTLYLTPFRVRVLGKGSGSRDYAAMIPVLSRFRFAGVSLVSVIPRQSSLMTHRVFVYGTLKKGQPNDHRLSNPSLGTTKFVGQAKLNERYPMVIASKYNIPFLLDKPGSGEVSGNCRLE